MIRYMWKGHVLEGRLEDYIRCHDEIWPEMTQMLNEAGVRNYSIWNLGNDLFGYYECDNLEETLAAQAASDVSRRWSEHMRGIVEMDRDPATGEKVKLRQVFLHEGISKDQN